MKLNTPIRPTKSPGHKIIIAITAIVLFGSGFCFSQPHENSNMQMKNMDTVYLDKNDPIFITIKGRTVSDLKQGPDTASAESKLYAAKIKTLTEDEQAKLEDIFVKSITEYATQTRFEPGTLMLHYKELQEKDPKNIIGEYDIRVQNLGGDKYAAEYWEDGIAVNSEANAQAAVEELVKRNLGVAVVSADVIKEKYANTRKSIEDGKMERYTKVIALLYVREKDGSFTFHYPYQALLDYILK